MIAVLKTIEDTPAKKLEVVEFQVEELKKYLNMWKRYKKLGIIQNADFEDTVWVVVTGVNVKKIIFKFNKFNFMQLKNKEVIKNITYDQFILSVKSYILYMLDSKPGSALVTFINALNILFREEVLLKSLLSSELKNYSTLMTAYMLIREYFAYIDAYFYNEYILEDYEECYLEFAQRSEASRSQRALPSIESMFKFNDIIEDFIRISNGKERERFFPIILWWKITTILPLRTHELCLIPKDCITKKDSKYMLKFYRNNLKGLGAKPTNFTHSFKECYKEYEFPISNEIVNLIYEYKAIVDKYDCQKSFYVDGTGGQINRKFLFSYRSYKQFRDYIHTYRDEREFFSTVLLNTLMKQFLIEIIKGKYNVDILPKSKDVEEYLYESDQISYIQLMDTRHFAILNMVYMGYEASTIQRVVGHKSIHTSYSYSNHTELFVNCYTISMARQMAFEKESKQKNEILNLALSNVIGKNTSIKERYKIIKNKRSEKFVRRVRLSEGHCIYEKTDMIPCKILRGNHRRCRYFVPDSNKLYKISEELNNIDKEISSEIKTLDYLMKNKSTIIGFKEAYKVAINKLQSKSKNKAEMVCDYIINGIDGGE